MTKILISIILIWFLIIESVMDEYGFAIPFAIETLCQEASVKLDYTWHTHRTCVDAGDITNKYLF